MVRRRTVWAAVVLVVLALLATGVATPDAQAASMHPKIKQKVDELTARSDRWAVDPGRFSWQIQVGGGWWARFENADLLYRPDLGRAFEVHGEIRKRWLGLGGPGTVGFPRGDEQAGEEASRYSRFDDGEIHWLGPYRRTTWLHGAIQRAYRSLPEGRIEQLGGVASDESSYSSGHPGTVRTDFSGGAIYYSPQYGATVLYGRERNRAESAIDSGGVGALAGPSRATSYSGWTRIPFSRGASWARSGDTRGLTTYGAIHRHHVMRLSVLGPPVDSETGAAGCGRRQTFTGGYLEWNASRGVTEVSGPLRAKLVKRLGYEPWLEYGCARTSASTHQDGTVRQEFDDAQIRWSGGSSVPVVVHRMQTWITKRGFAGPGRLTVQPDVYCVSTCEAAAIGGRLQLVDPSGSVVLRCTLPTSIDRPCSTTIPRPVTVDTYTVRYSGDATHLAGSWSVPVTRNASGVDR